MGKKLLIKKMTGKIMSLGKNNFDQTSLNLTMLGCLSDLWLIISLCTFSSICDKNIKEGKANHQTKRHHQKIPNHSCLKSSQVPISYGQSE